MMKKLVDIVQFPKLLQHTVVLTEANAQPCRVHIYRMFHVLLSIPIMNTDYLHTQLSALVTSP